MDRNSVIGFILIGIILMIWMWYNTPHTPPQQVQNIDTIQQEKIAEKIPEQAPVQEEIVSSQKDSLGKYFSKFATGEEKIAIIETDHYTAEITTKGGLIRKWELKEYKTWDKKHPVQLVDFDKGGDFSVLFNSSDGRLINTKNLYFSGNITNWQRIKLEKDSSYKITFILDIGNGAKLEKLLTFKNKKYSIDVEYKLIKMEPIIANFEYQVTWENGLRYAEHNSVDESKNAHAFAYAGGELTTLDASGEELSKTNISGITDWIATRNKYFAVAIISKDKKSTGAYLEGYSIKMPNNGLKKTYTIALKMPYYGDKDSLARFELFLGPLDFDIVKSYKVDLDQIMSLGAAWIIRPIAEYFMIPLFQFLRSFIPNYGIVIIIFSIIIKLLLHPLTKSSMRSMQKMQALQPMIEEVREKYKSDPQKMNQAIMRLYKDYGVNPAGGCLPLLLQLPILYALWAVFSSAIELRQAHFIWWITDLSVPDVLITLPFAIPIFGIRELSGLALAMGITMFIQQKLTVKDPRQKMMIWLMPLLLTLLFNFLPSGLNLYYFMFNLLSIVQQIYVTKKHKNEPLRKVEPKKKSGGIMSKLSQNMPKMKK
ncbi:MAG: Inner membrane protein translocase component YidC, long form [Ignavibacteriae bacterium]|nr:MAG: Inner membrane protein translocase component YidC, long form [Ignavibacteriota bacterium]